MSVQRGESTKYPAPSQTGQGPRNGPSGPDPLDIPSSRHKISHPKSPNQDNGSRNNGSPQERQHMSSGIRPDGATGSDSNAGSRSDKVQDADQGHQRTARADLPTGDEEDDGSTFRNDESSVRTIKMQSNFRMQDKVGRLHPQSQDDLSLPRGSKTQGTPAPWSLQCIVSGNELCMGSDGVTTTGKIRSGKGSFIPSGGHISELRETTAVTAPKGQHGLQGSEQQQLKTNRKPSEDTIASSRKAAAMNALASTSFSADQKVSGESISGEEYGNIKDKGQPNSQWPIVSNDKAAETLDGKEIEIGDNDKNSENASLPSLHYGSSYGSTGPCALRLDHYYQQGSESYTPSDECENRRDSSQNQTPASQSTPTTSGQPGETPKVRNFEQNVEPTNKYNEKPVGNDSETKKKSQARLQSILQKSDNPSVPTDHESRNAGRNKPDSIGSHKHVMPDCENSSVTKNTQDTANHIGKNLQRAPGESPVDIKHETSLSITSNPASNKAVGSQSFSATSGINSNSPVAPSRGRERRARAVAQPVPQVAEGVDAKSLINLKDQLSNVQSDKAGLEECSDPYFVEDLLKLEVEVSQDWLEAVGQPLANNLLQYLCNKYHCEYNEKKRKLSGSLYNVLQIQKVLKDPLSVDDRTRLESDDYESSGGALKTGGGDGKESHDVQKGNATSGPQGKQFGSANNPYDYNKSMTSYAVDKAASANVISSQPTLNKTPLNSGCNSSSAGTSDSFPTQVGRGKAEKELNPIIEEKFESTERCKPGRISRTFIVDSDVHVYVTGNNSQELQSFISKTNCELTVADLNDVKVKVKFEAAEKRKLDHCVIQYNTLIKRVVVKEQGIPSKIDIDMLEETIKFNNQYPNVSIQFNSETRMCKIFGFPQDDVNKTCTWINEIMISIDRKESSSVDTSSPLVSELVTNKKKRPFIGKVKDATKIFGGLNGNNSGKHVQPNVHSPNPQSAQKQKQPSSKPGPASQFYSITQGNQSSQPTLAVSGSFPILINPTNSFKDILGFMISSQRHIQVVFDDMLKPQHIKHVAVIVSPANRLMDCEQGLARLIMETAGRGVENDCKDHVRKFGPIEVSGLIRTTPGNLKNQYSKLESILHTVGPIPKDSTLADEILIQTRDTYLSCLLYANDVLSEASIAMPLFGAGMYKVPVKVITEAAFSALLEFERHLVDIDAKARKVKVIYFVSKNMASVKEMVQEFKRLIALNPSIESIKL